MTTPQFVLARLPLWVWMGLIGDAIIQLILVGHLQLSGDEAYYWSWAKHLQLSYFDHPPLVAWLIALSTAVFGDGEFGVRFFAPLALFGTSVLLAYAARDFGGDQRAMILAALLLPLTIAGQAIALIITPDTPLLFSAALLIFALARLYYTGEKNYWLLIGFAGGVAMLSKYTALVLGVEVLLWLQLIPSRRQELRCWQFWVGAVIAVAVFSPTLIWNAQHDWVSFIKQGERTLQLPLPSIVTFVNFIGAQLGLITPLLAVLIGIAAVKQFRRSICKEDRAVLLCMLGLPLPVYLALYAIGEKTEANWTLAALPALVVMTALAVSESWPKPKKFTFAAYGTGFVLSAALLIYLVIPWETGWGRRDITQRLSGNKELAEQIRNAVPDVCMITTVDYAATALLGYYLRERVAVIQLNEPERYEGWQRPQLETCSTKPILVLTLQRSEFRFRPYVSFLKKLYVLHRLHRNAEVEEYNLWLVKPGSAL